MIRAGVVWCHSERACEMCCHDVKWSEAVYTCATRAGVREVRSFGGSVFVVLLCCARVRACHGSIKGKL